MGDKKKRPPILNNLDRALMIAHNFEDRTAANVKPFRETTRQRYRALSKGLGMESGYVSSPLERTPENTAWFDPIYNGSLEVDFTTAARWLMLGYWDEHRVVYHVPKETLEFLDTTLHIEHWNAEVTAVVRAACPTPIYIETEGLAPYLGHFIGICPLNHHKLPIRGKNDILLTSIAVDTQNSFVNIALYREQSVIIRAT